MFRMRFASICRVVQPLSGCPANFSAAYTAIVEPNRCIIGLKPPDGGHLSHGSAPPPPPSSAVGAKPSPLVPVERKPYSYENVLAGALPVGDPQVYAIMQNEKQRQRQGLELIASENFASRAVCEALSSSMTNKYSEGLPGQRYYGGNEFIDVMERLCQTRALAVYGLDPQLWGANVQPLSGCPANFAAYTAVVEPNGRIMGLEPPDGRHTSHGFSTEKKKVSATSIFFQSMPYKVDAVTGFIDYGALSESTALFKPQVIIAGMTSCHTRHLDYARFRRTATSRGVYYLMSAMAHISFMPAVGLIPSPFRQCSDIVTTTTHKSLRGPRGALIFYCKGERSDIGAKSSPLVPVERKPYSYENVLAGALPVGDPQVYAIMQNEKQRQRQGLELIASENFASRAVCEALSSSMTNKYSEGLPGQRYYGGNEFIDVMERLCQTRALAVYGLDPQLWGANVQPLSGCPANFAATTAHKPLGGLWSRSTKGEPIMYDLHYRIDVFPGLQGGPHNHTISAIAVALEQAKTSEFVSYQRQVLANAQALSNRLIQLGYTLATGGTENHLCLVDLRPLGIDKNTCPGDKSALKPGGIRLGARALTSRDFKETDFQRVAFIHEVFVGAHELDLQHASMIPSWRQLSIQLKAMKKLFRTAKSRKFITWKLPIKVAVFSSLYITLQLVKIAAGIIGMFTGHTDLLNMAMDAVFFSFTYYLAAKQALKMTEGWDGSVRRVLIRAGRTPPTFLPPITFEATQLSNGFGVWTAAAPSAWATVGVVVDAGSRYENDKNNGVAHFLEHMAFKGTWKRTQTHLELEVENMGAYLNAYTSREQIVYYAKCFSHDVDKVVEILADILLNSNLGEAEMEMERSVILREMQEVEQNLQEVVFDHLHAVAFAGSSLARTILGPAENIESMQRTDLTNYVEDHFKAPRMVLVGAGGIDHGQLDALAAQHFGQLGGGWPSTAAVAPTFVPGHKAVVDARLSCTHGAVAVEGVGHRHPDYLPLLIANAVFRIWDSSCGRRAHAPSRLTRRVGYGCRLFTFQSFFTSYKDTGIWGMYFVARGTQCGDIPKKAMDEWKYMCVCMTDEHVARAKLQLQWSMLHGLDGATPLFHMMSKQDCVGDAKSLASMVEAIQGVDTATVRKTCMAHIYNRDTVSVVVGCT